jgi:magnesium-transporting ATPase (P-type)
MVAIRTLLMLMIALLFIALAIMLAARVRVRKGSLLYAKTAIVMAGVSAAATFIIHFIMALVYDPASTNGNLLVKQLYVLLDLFGMLILAFLGSFAIFSTYSGPQRKLIIALIFLLALLPTTYLTFSYVQATVAPISPPQPELYQFTPPPLTKYFYAVCGIPLGLTPILLFARSLRLSRERGDKLSANRAAIMFSAIALNEAEYFLYAFGGPSLEIPVLIAWIPIALFLLFAVLKITSPLNSGD